MFLKVEGRRKSKGYVVVQKRLEDMMWKELNLDLKIENRDCAGKVMKMDSPLEEYSPANT